MSEKPTLSAIREAYARPQGLFGHYGMESRAAEFDEAIAEAERAAAEKALTTMADELAALDDGGKRGLAGHSKSSASAITHRHAVAVVRARAAALGLTAGQEGENE